MPTADDIGEEQAHAGPAGLALLRALWSEALAAPEDDLDPAIHELITCQVVSIRYALLTQLLGKAVDPSRDALSI